MVTAAATLDGHDAGSARQGGPCFAFKIRFSCHPVRHTFYRWKAAIAEKGPGPQRD